VGEAFDSRRSKKFRDPIWRVSNLYSIRETWRKSDTLSATATAIAGPRHALPAQAQPNRYPQGAPDRFLDFVWRHLCGPALLEHGKAGLAGRQDPGKRTPEVENITVLAYDLLHPELKDRFVLSFGVRFFEYEAAQTSTMFGAPMPEGAQTSSFGYRNGGATRSRLSA
jgi:hypothetical protein